MLWNYKCSCYGSFLLEVKCPYTCSEKSLSDVMGQKPIFSERIRRNCCLRQKNSYYYQVQCQLNICEFDSSFFVIWTPYEVHSEKIKRDDLFFQQCLDNVNALVLHAILPEIIGCWYTKPRLPQILGHEGAEMVSSIRTSNGPYCSVMDGSKMICCDNENYKSRQWFHYRCVKISRVSHRKW